MREVSLHYGAERLTISLPNDTRVIQPKAALPRLKDVAAATREALLHPQSGPSLDSLAKPGAKVCIAFDDPAVFTFCDPDPRDDMLTAALEILLDAGVLLQDIHLLCANALHRKWTRAGHSLRTSPCLSLAAAAPHLPRRRSKRRAGLLGRDQARL